MGGPIYYELTYTVADGKEEEHEKIAKAFVVSSDKGDPDTILYSFAKIPGDAKNKWSLREVHKNEAALGHHFARVAESLPPWFGCMVDAKPDSFVVVGDYGEATIEGFKAYGAQFVPKGDGFSHTREVA
mmetsp:Transcript_10644/g.23644  ORF Transcript_10644/g.23644 Transcript_10644/m.23644 type:complete len:129 (+) Transcript_10644:70-456(+)